MIEQNNVANLDSTEQSKFKFPTETVELPSRGLLYPEGNPLASGKVEIKYMTAKEEDILSNQNYLSQGTVIDKLLQSLIVTKFSYSDLLIGDKNAILIAARILGYGKDYDFISDGRKVTADLSTLENKPLKEDLITKGINSFEFTLPNTKTVITFKALTHGDEQAIDREIKGLQKINPSASADVSTRMKYVITSVNGDSEKKTVREFVDNYFLAKDLRAFRQYYKEVAPDVDMVTNVMADGDVLEGVEVGIGLNFFWPDAGI